MRVVGECFFWYRLTRVFPDKFHRAVKRLCVCVYVIVLLPMIVFVYMMTKLSGIEKTYDLKIAYVVLIAKCLKYYNECLAYFFINVSAVKFNV